MIYSFKQILKQQPASLPSNSVSKMNIFPPYTVLLISLRILSVHAMSFDLPYYGYNSYLDGYLDNANDDIFPEELNCEGDGSAAATMEPPPLLGCTTRSSYPSGCENREKCDKDRDRDREKDRDCDRDRDGDRERDWDRNRNGNRDRDRDKDRDNDRNRDRNNYDSSESDTNKSRLKATHIAQNAAQVAKAANDAQAAAAMDASRQVKMQLADKAICAARAADAVLEGKLAIVDNYAREIREAEAVVEQVSSSLEVSETNVDAACAVAKAAELQAASFRALVEQTRGTLSDLDGLMEQSNGDLEEKSQMLAAAKARGDRLARQVAQARSEYEQVREAACRAASAAVEAKQKVTAGILLPTPTAAPVPRPQDGCGHALDSNTCNALLELYRQRRRQQQRLRREKLLKGMDRYREPSLYGDHSFYPMRSLY
ncbi:uncharacterized protein Dyak_GE17695 [Drosophila yakuba]|uniref:Uncharacterized protein n=1 Tax=Drosophila yakuba TaxID=7245 RepID=B4Q2L7_DROYA|nr:uncharacterized protein Dyak_GE17695 [Drosophila yakuba]